MDYSTACFLRQELLWDSERELFDLPERPGMPRRILLLRIPNLPKKRIPLGGTYADFTLFSLDSKHSSAGFGL
jgi:hypothetical protein